ncbi:SpoIIE family protein phosphatase/ATP-binding protein [Streptomyces sodiiphilus]|uniref:SpoIIE family protein phosphatase/ATP-binding protein n=1 Tax=Streptomyces sodiiphilus TaxID=226217 RepID=A0ABN2NS83_9ACTN
MARIGRFTASLPRPRWLGGRSAAGQVFVLQMVIVLMLVTVWGAVLVLQTQRENEREAEARAVSVAETFSRAPGLNEMLMRENPSTALQPLTNRVRVRSGVDFVVVMTTDGVRYTHPNPDRIGERFVGTITPARLGATVTESIASPLGPAVQAVAPVYGPDGSIIALVAAGITVSSVAEEVGRELPLLLGTGAAGLALAVFGTAALSRRLSRQTHGLGPLEMARMYEHHDAVLHAVREGVLILDGEGRLLLANDEARRLLELPADAEGRHATDLGLEPATAELLTSRRPAADEVHMAGDRLLAVNQQPTDVHGGPAGSVATFRDTTELRALSGRAETAQRRLRLLYDAGVRMGTTLDVTRTAQDLADVVVPRFADHATVDLTERATRGDEPLRPSPGLSRAATSGTDRRVPLYPPGELGEALTAVPRLWELTDGRPEPAEVTAQLERRGIRSLCTVPLRAGGEVLGVARFYRSGDREPFDAEDLSLAEELAARAAVSIDNAGRYTREHTMAVTLQRSLLPRGLPEQNALEVASRYLPAHAGVGGDWFDVIPLSGARVALVVGDVVGHGLHAAATMGRLRTAVHNFSTLDLPPDELLAHLDELVARIDHEEPDVSGSSSLSARAITGATCLYAVYDPVSRTCTMARAGHPQPALVHPDGSVRFWDLPAGPPLGLGGLPFQVAEQRVPEGSRLVLYTDGLVENRTRDIDEGLEMLRDALAGPDRSPEETCRQVLDAMLPARSGDDIALLVARTRVLDPGRVAEWYIPDDPAAVSRVRADVSRRLTAWDLDDIAFSTELILSELVTNALRHASGPIRVRLLHDRALICEVSDTSSTSPHLRYAEATDEGGRGLFLVAQFADRWGTRYTPEGKVIWAEQPLPGTAFPPGGNG